MPYLTRQAALRVSLRAAAPVIAVFALLAGLAICGSPCKADPADERHWWPGFAFPGLWDDETRAKVFAAAEYNGRTVVGGDFDKDDVFGPPLHNVAAWNGTYWEPLGDGFNKPVTSLILFKGELFAAGEFDSSGTQAINRIARWDGAVWQPLGQGVNDPVHALAIYGNKLIAGGDFTTAGGSAVGHIAAWSGSAWSALGPGVNNHVDALQVHDNKLYVGGWFYFSGAMPAKAVAVWNGTGWAAMGAGLWDGGVNALTVWNGQIVAGGNFTYSGETSCLRIAYWDGGSWQPFMDGEANGVNDDVYALCTYDGALIASGPFTAAGQLATRYLARWTGSAWESFGGVVGTNGVGESLIPLSDGLIVGGIAGTWPDENDLTHAGEGLLRWDGSNWQGYGEGVNDFYIQAMILHDDQLLVSCLENAGNDPVTGTARWDGRRWHPFGGLPNMNIYDYAIYNGELIAGGSFTNADGSGANYIAKWDGDSWVPLDAANQPDDTVAALYVYGTDLIVGGEFTQIGGITCENVARWNGSSWSPMGSGLNGWGPVRAFAAYGGFLVAGGSFHSPSRNLAIWDGSSWLAFGNGADDQVRTLEVYGGDLFVGGEFTTINSQPIPYLARYAGAAWLDVAGGTNGPVYALGEYHGSLIVGGDFTEAGGSAANHLARWTGTVWETIGSGTDGPVTSLQAHADSLFVGGEFFQAGGMPSSAMARWTDSCYPEAETFEDLLHITQGCASLVLSTTSLILDDIGSTGEDGVAIATGELSRVWYARWETPSPLSSGDYIETSAFGPWGATPEERLGTMRITMESAKSLRVRLAYDIPNCNSVLYQAYRNGAPVATVTGVVGDVLATPLSSGDPMVDAEQVQVGESDHRRAFIVRWSDALNVQLPGLADVQANEVRVQPVELSSDYSTVRRVTVHASGVPQITFRAEEVAGMEGGGEPSAGRLELRSAYPNPVRDGATVLFSIPSKARVSVNVFDVQGRRIRRVFDGPLGAGTHRAEWDGRDDQGRRLPAGVYFVRVGTGRENRACQVVLAR